MENPGEAYRSLTFLYVPFSITRDTRVGKGFFSETRNCLVGLDLNLLLQSFILGVSRTVTGPRYIHKVPRFGSVLAFQTFQLILIC